MLSVSGETSFRRAERVTDRSPAAQDHDHLPVHACSESIQHHILTVRALPPLQIRIFTQNRC